MPDTRKTYDADETIPPSEITRFGWAITNNRLAKKLTDGGRHYGDVVTAIENGETPMAFRLIASNCTVYVEGLCWGDAYDFELREAFDKPLANLFEEPLAVEFYSKVDEEWREFEKIPGGEERLTRYERDALSSAEHNHIWQNAFGLIRPSKETYEGIGKAVVNMWKRRENRIKGKYIKKGEGEDSTFGDVLVLRFNAS